MGRSVAAGRTAAGAALDGPALAASARPGDPLARSDGRRAHPVDAIWRPVGSPAGPNRTRATGVQSGHAPAAAGSTRQQDLRPARRLAGLWPPPGTTPAAPTADARPDPTATDPPANGTGASIEERFLAELRRSRAERVTPLPAHWQPLARAVAGDRPVAVRSDRGAARALRAIGKRAATIGGVVHLARPIDRLARAAEVVSHELVHVAHPAPTPRFFDGAPSGEERKAHRVGHTVARLAGLADRSPVSAAAARRARPDRGHAPLARSSTPAPLGFAAALPGPTTSGRPALGGGSAAGGGSAVRSAGVVRPPGVAGRSISLARARSGTAHRSSRAV
ncbi:MAG: DUF4157 domain-containing protein, partial [Acidimicrobiia bacterium]|nr:DUF4157 domain-containing protein [Acidimicrobiia bacterium]